MHASPQCTGRTKLIDGLHKQVDRVTELLARDGIGQDVAVRGMLCFVEGELALDWRFLHYRWAGRALAQEGARDHHGAWRTQR